MPPADAMAPIASSGSRWLRPDFSSPIGAASYATGAAEGTAVARGYAACASAPYASAASARGPPPTRERKAEGARPLWRRNALANWAGWR